MIDRMKTLIKKVLGSMGYQISRLQHTKGSNESRVLHFGPYPVESDCLPLIEHYENNPDANQYLGRLAALLGSSEPELGIIDVGANCGDTAALMRSHTSLPILCVEGDPRLYSFLQRNSLHCPDVTPIQCYVGEVSGSVSVTIEKEGWNNTLVPSESAGSVIQIVRLDELSHSWIAGRRIGFLKIDAEGFDIPILFGARNLLAKSRPVISFEYNRENMDAISEPGLRVFPYLAILDYEGLLIYDSPGRYLMSAAVQDLELLTELHEFIRAPTCGIRYWDIVAFPREEAALFRKFRDSERGITHSES